MLATPIVAFILLATQQGTIPIPPGVSRLAMDACPWEDCELPHGQRWTAADSFTVYSEPSLDATPLFRLDKGTRVTVIGLATYIDQVGVILVRDSLVVGEDTGEPIVVRAKDTLYVIGKDDVFSVVWLRGKVTETEDLPVDPYNDYPATQERATLLQPLRWSLWKHVRQPDGRTGWLRAWRYPD